METVQFYAKDHVNAQAGCHCLCAHKEFREEYVGMHFHDYYEVFLVYKGEIRHLINEEQQLLGRGALLFVRDFDRHVLRSCNGNDYSEFNLAFTKETFEEILSFWGNGFDAEPLFKADVSPVIILSDADTEKLASEMLELIHLTDKNKLRFKARTLLISIFSTYFQDYKNSAQNIPYWLVMTCEKMKENKNFVAGVKRMNEISGKSREYLSRSMQQHYHMTPTAYVTELRLIHAANLLILSNLAVTDICYECGFENLSWFYKRFIARFGMPPKKYRENHLSEISQQDNELSR